MTTTADVPFKGPNQRLPNPGETLPKVAVPTVLLFFTAFAVWCVSVGGMLAGTLPWQAVILINAAVSFVMFTVLHDCTHHAIGRSDWINELFGRLSTLWVTSYASFSLVRFIHIEHHRNANEGMWVDPDGWASAGPLWQQPLRWATMDIWYAIFWLRHSLHRPLSEVVETGLLFLATIAALFWCAVNGYLFEALVIYVIPQRIAVFLLVWWFDWLPHHGLEDTARENRFRATRNRVGLEWLMTPLMLYQNYHLVHHLHPAIPFYRYISAWRRNEQAYLANDPALSTVMGREVSPEEYRSRRNLPAATAEDSAEARSARERATFYPLPVAEVHRITEDAVTVSFDVPEAYRDAFRFRQGQHITIRCNLGGEGIRRNYSICSPVGSERLRIGIKRIEGGAFSNYAFNELKPGDALEVMPPSGRFFTQLDAHHAKAYVAIAAGSGITPILSIIATTLEVEQESKFVLLYGNKSVSTTMFLDELQALKAKYPERFQVLYCLSRPQPGDPEINGSLEREVYRGALDRQLLEGRIDRAKLSKMLATFVDPEEIDDWFLCGPQELVEEARNTIVYHGVDAQRIHLELFIAAPTRKPGDTAPADNAPTSAVRIHCAGKETQIEIAQEGETILDAAMRERDDLPYSCLGGACGTCRARLTEGTVEMEQNFALDAEELEAGYVLTCQSRPTSDRLVLDYDA